MRYPIYESHDEIPKIVADYILAVSDERNLSAIPMDYINDFLDMLNEREKEKLLYFPKRNYY